MVVAYYLLALNLCVQYTEVNPNLVRRARGPLSLLHSNGDGADAFCLLFGKSRATPLSFSKMAAEKPWSLISHNKVMDFKSNNCKLNSSS
jgi:hypothetical protein